MPVKMNESSVKTLPHKSNRMQGAHAEEVNNMSKCSIAGRNIPLTSIKLNVALELKAEGYTHIEFDRVVELNDLKTKIHVFGEDELGVRLAVLCINKPEKLDVGVLADAVEAIQRVIGEEGDVALAIPIGLLEKSRDIFGITNRVFLVDWENRVWSHSCDNAYIKMIKHAMLMQHECTSSEDEDADPQANLHCGWQGTSLSYVA